MGMETPVLFCIFNRPQVTAEVFEAIRLQRPKRLLVVCDGPRPDRPGEAELVEESRAIIHQTDWDCEIETCYSEENLGCRLRMASGLDWGFSRAERLVILEDDCLPHSTFFEYCERLLDRYADDSRIGMISGNNFQPEPLSEESYYFSRWTHIWGWASWRRAWQHFDLNISLWPEVREQGLLSGMVDSDEEEQYWQTIFDEVYAGNIDAWSYSWMFACWLHGMLSVLPQRNLVSNLGFGPDATHTISADSPLAMMETFPNRLTRHPNFVVRNRRADAASFRSLFRGPEPQPMVEERLSWFSPKRIFRRSK